MAAILIEAEAGSLASEHYTDGEEIEMDEMTDAEHNRREAEECRALADAAARDGWRLHHRFLTDEARQYDRRAEEIEVGVEPRELDVPETEAAAAPEFLAACQGRPSAEVTNLEWLAALLDELRNSEWPSTAQDPDAAWEALAQSEHLLAGLCEAMKKAHGEESE